MTTLSQTARPRHATARTAPRPESAAVRRERLELEEMAREDAITAEAVAAGKASVRPSLEGEGLKPAEFRAISRALRAVGLPLTVERCNEAHRRALTEALAKRPRFYASPAEWPAWTDQEIWGDENGAESCSVDSFDIGLIATNLLGLDTETALRRLVRA